MGQDMANSEYRFMEITSVINYPDKFIDTIWICQTFTGRAYEHGIWPVVIIDKYRYFFRIWQLRFWLEECKIDTVLVYGNKYASNE